MHEEENVPIEELVARWRVTSTTRWDEIVGHERAIRRLRELAALIALAPAERARLGLRLGAGVAIIGPPGVGKSLVARAFAAAVRRPIVAPPPGELTPARIAALYRALADGEPAIVVLDESENLIGDGDFLAIDADAERALLSALDGIEHPDAGPITLALTTEPVEHLAEAAIRPGRLAPRLVLDGPTAAERRELLRRAVDGLPGAEAIDLARVAERMATWSGAAIVEGVREAMRRSLVPEPDGETAAPGLRMDLLLQVAGDEWLTRDSLEDEVDPVVVATHEAGHALAALLAWGRDPDTGESPVARMAVHERNGETELAGWVRHRAATRAELRRMAALSYAGTVAERLILGAERMTVGGSEDRANATKLLASLRALDVAHDDATLASDYPSLGAEAMKRVRYEAIRVLANETWQQVRDMLEPQRGAILRLAAAVLAAPDRTLSGAELDATIARALQGDQEALA